MGCGVFVLWADVARRGQRHKTLVLGVHQSCLIKSRIHARLALSAILYLYRHVIGRDLVIWEM